MPPADNLVSLLLTSVLLPPGPSVLALLLAALVPRQKVRMSLFVFGLASLYLSSTPAVSNWLRMQLEVAPPVALQHHAAEAIVVLGADRRREAVEFGGGDTIARLGLERLRYAAWLQKKTGLPLLASGGSVEPGQVPEAELMRDILREFGVETTWLESHSRNTFENAMNTARILKGLGIGEVLLVTHGWHMPRAAEAFQFAGLRVIPAPTGLLGPNDNLDMYDWLPNASSLQMSYWALHEMLGRIWYHYRYYRQP